MTRRAISARPYRRVGACHPRRRGRGRRRAPRAVHRERAALHQHASGTQRCHSPRSSLFYCLLCLLSPSKVSVLVYTCCRFLLLLLLLLSLLPFLLLLLLVVVVVVPVAVTGGLLL